jgi:T-complex protein 1 subunit epsilon
MIDMRANFVIDPLIGKRQQLLLATQLCRMVSRSLWRSLALAHHSSQVLKINNVIFAGGDDNDF